MSRLLGEPLVLYKDRSGTYGLIEPLCAHRRINLLYDVPLPHSLRCPYHGWAYDETGVCIEQPYTVVPLPRERSKVHPLSRRPVMTSSAAPAPVVPSISTRR